VRLQLFVLAYNLGKLPAAGGAAQSSSTLDTDDVAGETHQDWGEGRAPFPEDNLPDGGSGGAARVVSGHSGRDWAAEIGNGLIRMKEETQQSHENNARKRCLRIREKMGVGSQLWHRNSPVPVNNRNGLEKSSCQSVEQAEITKKAYAGRGQETKWEMSDQFVFGFEIRKTRMLASFPFSIVKISSPKMRFGSSLGP